MIRILNPTDAQVSRMVELEFGPAATVGDMVSRYRDLGRDYLAGRAKPTSPEAAVFLAELQADADRMEQDRIAAAHVASNEAARVWGEFVERRASLTDAPESFRDLVMLDQRTGNTVRLRLPSEFIVAG